MGGLCIGVFTTAHSSEDKGTVCSSCETILHNTSLIVDDMLYNAKNFRPACKC